MKIQPYGDQALLVRFDEQIDPKINQQVLSLYEMIKREDWVQYLIPAYQSLTIGIEPKTISLAQAYELISEMYTDSVSSNPHQKHLVIPVCYEGIYSPDMVDVEKTTGLSASDIIEIHTSQVYHVYMLGFVAGFPYMGSLPKALHCPRKAQPRLKVAQGSIGLAGAQTGIYPTEAPSGWQLIGQTPIPLFIPAYSPPNTLNPGDRASFRAISEDEFKLIKIKVETGIYEPEIAYE